MSGNTLGSGIAHFAGRGYRLGTAEDGIVEGTAIVEATQPDETQQDEPANETQLAELFIELGSEEEEEEEFGVESSQLVPAGLTGDEVDSCLINAHNAMAALVHIVEVWQRVIFNHKYAAEAKIAIESHHRKLLNMMNDVMSNFGMLQLPKDVLDKIRSESENLQAEHDKMETEVKPFLPTDFDLALQLEPIRELTTGNDHLAKRLRRI